MHIAVSVSAAWESVMYVKVIQCSREFVICSDVE